MHVILFALCVRVLFRRKRKMQLAMLVAVVIMFVLATADVGVSWRIAVRHPEWMYVGDSRAFMKAIYPKFLLHLVNGFLADVLLESDSLGCGHRPASRNSIRRCGRRNDVSGPQKVHRRLHRQHPGFECGADAGDCWSYFLYRKRSEINNGSRASIALSFRCRHSNRVRLALHSGNSPSVCSVPNQVRSHGLCDSNPCRLHSTHPAYRADSTRTRDKRRKRHRDHDAGRDKVAGCSGHNHQYRALRSRARGGRNSPATHGGRRNCDEDAWQSTIRARAKPYCGSKS